MNMGKTTILIIFLIVLSASQDFNQYVAKFKKNYANATQRARRQALYLAKWAEIKASNAQNSEFALGENEFTDRTEQEAQRMAGLKKIILANEPISYPPQPRLKSKLAQRPLSVDWRTQGKVSAVKSQGSCGSCWAFTVTAFMQSWLMIGGAPEYDLSQQYALECTTANSPQQTVSSCDGGIVQYALPFVLRTGMPLEADFPYLADTWSSPSPTPTTSGICSAPNLIVQTNLSGVYQGSYTNLTTVQIQDILAYGPVTAAIFANTAFMSYSSGVYAGCPDFNTSVSSLNHAILVVGYDSNGNYIIKNSWGTNWGENGFATISKDFDCGITSGPREVRGTNIALVDTTPQFENMLVLVASVFSIIMMVLI